MSLEDGMNATSSIQTKLVESKDAIGGSCIRISHGGIFHDHHLPTAFLGLRRTKNSDESKKKYESSIL